MGKDFITLSKREIERLRIIHRVIDKQMTQIKASELLGLTDRQVRNIIGKVRDKGDEAIAHGNRGRVAPNKMPAELEEWIGEIVKRRYPDFGPTFASEKLLERDGIEVGREKLRSDELLRGESAQTQFERACGELGIEVIHAHSPQAKGRIERVFGTFQDRLVKEMRLAGGTGTKTTIPN